MHHRALGLWQVEPGVRHDLRGRPEAVRRVALRLRPPVPPDDGEAGRRLDRRPQPGDLDRPEDDEPQPTLDGRHRHGDLRLPAAPVCPGGAAALPRLRPADRRPVDRGDRRPGAAAPGGDAIHGQRAGRPRSQGGVPRRLRGAPSRRLHARQGRRRAAAAGRRDRPRQEVQAHDRGRRRPARDEARPAHAPVAVDRDGRRARGRPRRDRPPRRGGAADVLGEVRLPRARGLAARAPAANLLVQLAPRRLPALHRARGPAGDRPRPARPRPDSVDRRGGARAVVGRQLELLRVRDPGDRRSLRDRPRCALAGAHEPAAGLLPLRHERRPRLRHVPQPDGAEALVHAGLRGDRREPLAPLPRDRLVPGSRADRGVHELPPVPRVRRRAAEARGAGGHRRRQEHPRVHADVGVPGARVPGRPRSDDDRASDRRSNRQGDPRAPDLPGQRRRGLPAARPRRRDAVRRRGAAVAAGDPDRVSARRGPLHPGRAVDRAPPARQRQADRDAPALAGSRQHRARGRARRADDARRRLARGHGAGRGRTRRPRGRRGARCPGRAAEGVGDGPVPLREAPDPDSGAARGR